MNVFITVFKAKEMSGMLILQARRATDLIVSRHTNNLYIPFICPIQPVISKHLYSIYRVLDLTQLVNSTNNLVQQPSSDTPPTSELEDSDPLFSRGFFFLLLISCLH